MSSSEDLPKVSFYDGRNSSEREEAASELRNLYTRYGDSPPSSAKEVSDVTGISRSDLEEWVSTIKAEKQVIFYGPPGTGKTFLAKHLSRMICGQGGEWDLVQFHPAYSYEDFMQGLRPETTEEGALSYRMKPGRFLDFCETAEETDSPCVLIIDEINRANLSKVFGELMYLLEYREEEIPLAAGEREGEKKKFSIPENVHIIGTMNTADRSIALVDFALRRRFAFIPLFADDDFLEEVIERYHDRVGTGFPTSALVEELQNVNETIGEKSHAIGPSYFLREDLGERIEEVWKYEIVPYLEEYFFSQPEEIDQFRWENVKDRILPNQDQDE
ncbi:MoxR-like ATPase [Salinibacter ruber]|uniref:McrB family protein n=1 Tax=Salinibacter ruber TaxID=146919 RepID=UPI00216A4842|nr:AAA family ATPase [Salinibacter ruber]MCS4044564.1 MoxR-like ATPase [Salinibacter ruber]